MKMKLTIVLLSFLLLSALHASEKTDFSDALKVARNFVGFNQLEIDLGELPDVRPIAGSEGELLAWAFEGSKGGYVVVSASRYLEPVIAYHSVNRFPGSSLLTALVRSDLQLRIQYSLKNADRLKQLDEQWQALLEYSGAVRTYQQWPEEGTTPTGGWVVTQWHQGAPFNMFTPVRLSDQQRSVVGCPATAMSQIINYHREINGTRLNASDRYYHNYLQQFWIDDAWETYEFLSFDSLNHYLQSIEVKFAENLPLDNEEKAALSLATGFACKTVYTPSVSGTFGVSQAYDAYQRFGFHTAVLLDHAHSDAIIRETMIQNIKKGKPVHLAVVDPQWQSGHNMVCDGYRDNGFFHLNMGWGGSLDAWYNLPQGIPYNLTVFEGVIVNINFSQTEFAVSFSVVRNDQPLEGALISIAESGHVLTTDLNGTAAASLEPGNYSYVLEYQNEVLLEDVFVVESDDVTIEIILNSLNVAINCKALKVFPNPFSRLINVGVPSAVLSVKVFDLQGKQVYHRSPLTDSELLTIDMHDQPAGTYLLVVVLLNGDVFTGKIIQTLH